MFNPTVNPRKMKPCKLILLLLAVLNTQVIFTQTFSNQFKIEQLEKQADSLLKVFKYDSAATHFIKIAEYYKKNRKWLACVKNYRLAGNFYLRSYKSDSALHFIQISLKIAEKQLCNNKFDESLERSDIYLIMGEYFRSMGIADSAMHYYHKALEMNAADTISMLKKADILNKMAMLYLDLNLVDSALNICNKALSIRNFFLDENTREIADSYFLMGRIYDFSGIFENSLEYYLKALQIRTSLYGDIHPDVAYCYNNLGCYYYNIGQFNKAIEFGLKALNIRILVFGEQHPETADSYLNLGVFNDELNLYNKAKEYYVKSVQSRIVTNNEQWKTLAFTYTDLGSTSYESGNCDDALEYFKKAIFIFDSLFGAENIYSTIVKVNVSEIFLKKGELDNAETCIQNAYAHLSTEKEKVFSTHDYYNQQLGRIYLMKGDYENALNYTKKALENESSFYDENHPEIAEKYLFIGGIYFEIGEFDMALEYFQKSLNTDIEIFGENNIELVPVFSNIAAVYLIKKEYLKSVEYFRKCLIINSSWKIDNAIEITSDYLNIAMAYYEMKELDSSLFYLKKSLQITSIDTGVLNSVVIENYCNIGYLYSRSGNMKEAIHYIDKALKTSEKLYSQKHPYRAYVLNAIGDYYLTNHEYDSALNYLQKALVANAKDFNDTSVYSNPTLNNILSRPYLIITLAKKGQALNKRYLENTGLQQDLFNSLACYELVCRLINDMKIGYRIEESKLYLSINTKQYFDEAMNVVFEFENNNSINNHSKIFEFIERGKSISIYSRFNELKATRFSGIPDSLINLEKELQQREEFCKMEIYKEENNNVTSNSERVKYLENMHFNTSRKLDSLISFFETSYPVYYDLKYANNTANISDIQKTLDGRTVLLDYFLGDTSLFIAAVADSSFNVYKIDIGNSFRAKVENYFSDIKTAETDSFLIESQMLYNYLIKPVRQDIAGKNHLIIIPDDCLYYIPFETLIDTATAIDLKDEIYSRANYLIKDFAITYHHSATLWYQSILKAQIQPLEANRKFAGFAPVFDRKAANGTILARNIPVIDTSGNSQIFRSVSRDMKHFNPLPYSEKEVVSIAGLFEKKHQKAVVYLYQDASETNFKDNAGGYTYVHISSHGFSNDNIPALSGIAFSQPAMIADSLSEYTEDGVLYAGETYSLNLNADLLVLSSCESGLGKLIKGEGLMALSRGFLYSGTPNIVFSLWKVLDKPTKDLMVEFYAGFLEGKSYSEALREAKLTLIADRNISHPHFWSGFLLIGRD